MPEAEIIQLQALTELRKVLGAESVYTLSAESHCAALLKQQGKLKAAQTQYRKTLATLSRTEGSDKIETLDCMFALSNLLREQGQLPEALTLAREAAENARRTLHKRDYRVGVFLAGYGQALVASGQLQDAEPVFQEAQSRLSFVETVNPIYFPNVIRGFIFLYEARDEAEPGKGFNGNAAEWQKN